MGLPLISRYSSAKTLGPLSIALPDPSKIRPSISSDTPSFKLSPLNSTFVFLTSIPGVPSKTWTMARLPVKGEKKPISTDI